MNVDIKGDAKVVKKFCKMVDVDHVWAAAKLASSRGVQVEITTLVIPAVNDSDSVLHGIAERIAGDLGHSMPWHVTSYYPAYQFAAHPHRLRLWRAPGGLAKRRAWSSFTSVTSPAISITICTARRAARYWFADWALMS
jgi:pyruvate-formate lyase-activating enzyme